MTEEKIIEIAERYGRLENIDHGLAWVIGEDALLDFVQAAIQKETKEYNDLIAHAIEVLRRKVKPARKSRPQPKARLTDEDIEEIHKEFPSRLDLLVRAIERKILEKVE
jgi:hypothetical protein